MAVTQNTYTGDGATVLFSFTFPYLETTDIKVSLDGSVTTAYTLANATTIQFNTAPANGVAIRIFRQTDDSALSAQFYTGSAIRSQDLNDNFTQVIYKVQETTNYSVQDAGNITLSGTYNFGSSVSGQTPVSSSNFATKGYVDGIAFSSGNLVTGDKGDVTVNSANSWTINNDAVTTSKIVDGDVTEAKLSFTPLKSTDLGVSVQAYDADTAKLDVAQTFTAIQTLTDPAIIGTILEDVYTISDGAAFEVDPGNGSVQLITLGANRTPLATNFAAGESVTLMVDDGTAYAITWTDTTWGPSGVIWTGGSAPTLATSGYTVIQLWKVGSQVYGAKVGEVA